MINKNFYLILIMSLKLRLEIIPFMTGNIVMYFGANAINESCTRI